MGLKIIFAAALCTALLAAPAMAQPHPTTPAAIAPPVPLATFARLPETERPRISTDGSALAMKVRVGGQQVLAVVALDTPGARPEIIARDADFDQRDQFHTTNWAWIDPDNLLIWVESRTDVDGEKVDASRVIAYNRRTHRTTRLGWDGTFVYGSDVIWRSTSGPPRILLARVAAGHGTERLFNREVIEIDVTTGQQHIIEPQTRGVTNWYADGAGNVRLGTGTDRNTGRVQALYRSGGDGNFRTIYHDRTDRYRETPVPIVFLPGDKALVISNHEGFRALYEMDLNTMEFTRKVYGVDGYDIDDVNLNPAGDGVEGISTIENGRVYHWLDPRLREIQAALDETYGAGNAVIASADRARRHVVIHVGGADQTGSYQLYDTGTGDMHQIGWVNTVLRDTHLNPVRTVRYQASDGQTIAAVLTLPRLRAAHNLPLIVLPHGGPWARDYETWDMWAQPLAEMGYAVIQPNYRGSTGYGYAWQRASDGNWGMRMQDDLNDAITYLAAQGIADPARVCMFGWSYGGYAASRAAQRDPSLYRCTISGAGVHDIPDMVAYDRNYLGPNGATYIGSAAARLADISPARHTDGRWAPILIVHGTRDDRVPVTQSRNLVSRLRASGKVEGRDFVYVEQPRNTHHLPLEADRLQLLDEMQRFLIQHNPSGMPAVAVGSLGPAAANAGGGGPAAGH